MPRRGIIWTRRLSNDWASKVRLREKHSRTTHGGLLMKNVDRLSACGRVLAAATIVFLTSSIASSAQADSTRWRTVVGIVQAGNVVGGIPGGGQPWTTLGGRARVDLVKGQLDFDVQGLVLAGGNSIGTPAAVNQVKGTLVCIVAGATPVILDTTPVPLSPQGDADFSGPIGPIPSTCTSTNVAFLVRIAASGAWIANGAVRFSQGNN